MAPILEDDKNIPDRTSSGNVSTNNSLAPESVKKPNQPSPQQPRPNRIFKVSKRGTYVSQDGIVYNAQGTDFISEEESTRYRQDSINEFTMSQAKAEQTRARLAGNPINLEEAIERVRTRDLGLNTNPVTGAVVAPSDVKSQRPLTPDEIDEVAMRRFPTLALVAKSSGLSREEQQEAVRLPLAMDAARRIVNTRNPARQQQILNTMGPDMQALLIDIVQAWQDEAERNTAVSAEEDSGNVITDAIGFAWDKAFGPMFDGLFWLTEKGVQAATATSWMSSGMSPQEAWEVSQPGVLDPEMVDYARKTFGDTTVDVILDARDALDSKDPNAAIAEVWDKYATADDIEKLSILEQALSLSAYDQNTMDAIGYLSAAETGNIGNVFTWSFLSVTGVSPISEEGTRSAVSPIFNTTKNTVNVISMFAFDPLIVGSKFNAIRKLNKYGIGKGDPATIEKAMNRPAVQNFFNTVGAGLTRVDEAENSAEAAQIMNSLRSQYKNSLTPEALEALRWSGVRSAEDAAIFMDDARVIELMTKGQFAKRKGQITLPHMVLSTSLAKRASLVARGLTYDRNASKNIDEIFGKGVSDLVPEEAIPVIINRLAEPGGDKFVGRMLSDFVFAKGEARRTFLGSLIGPALKGAGQYNRPAKAISRYGFKRKGGPRSRLERVARTQAHMPDVSNGLRIDDASDAAKVRDLMLYGGMPKYWADYSQELWKVMTPGQRKEFAGGIGRSVGYALGVDIVDPVSGARLIDNMVSGMRTGELYAPNYIDMPSIRAAAEKQTKDKLLTTTEPAWNEGPTLFHGTSQRFEKDKLTEAFYLPQSQNIAGSGFYSTTGFKTATQGYVKKGGGKEPITYTVRWVGGRPPVVLDADAPAPDFVREYIKTQYNNTTFDWGSDAISLADNPNTSTLDLIIAFRKDMSYGGTTPRLEVEEIINDLNYVMQENGFDALKHAGGKMRKDAIEEHDVYVWLNTDNISVSDTRALTQEEIKAQFKADLAVATSEAPILNPSLLDDGSSAALYDYQMTPIINFPNMAALDQMSLRQSYLTALLGDNGKMSFLTDWWTLGTIAGPRFFLRNGIEDAGLYALTEGSWKGYRYGQLYSKAAREATQRIDAKDANRVRGRKLGLAPSATRWLGDRLPRALNGIILPHLDESEIALAKKMSDAGDRSGLVKLIHKAFLRQKLIFIKKPANERYIRYLDEAAEEEAFYSTMDEASETTEGLASSAGVGIGADQTTKAILNGEIQDVAGIVLPYNTKQVIAEDQSSITAWYNNLNSVIYGDGNKVETVGFLKEYYSAKLFGTADDVERTVSSYAKHLQSKNKRMVDSSAIAQTEGVNSFARRKLDDALRVFTTKDGSFNDDLLNKIRREDVAEDGTVKVTYRLYDVVDGKQTQRVTIEDLVNMPGKPYSALSVDNMTVPLSKDVPIRMRVWSAMGRSLARFTREPIFVANYLDARDFIAPLESRIASEYGQAYARKWAVEAAYERAFATTMAYVDNPNVRSQLSWNIRNVYRFYRAQEDFMRRMMRIGKNNPVAIQRLNVAWHALDETGFIHEDEFGDKYFVWPGNKATLTAINNVTGLFGINVLEGGALTDFTSKVTMLSPSADPNALFPTIAGPYGATAFTGLMELFPGLRSFQDEVMGEYSVGRSWWETVIPTNAQKALNLGAIAFKQNDFNDTDTMYADSARAAIQIYASTGLIDQTKQYSNTELANLKDDLNTVAIDITILRSIAGPVMPAAVSTNPQTVTDFAKSMGVSGMRKVFIELLKANDNDYHLALSKWIKANPGLSIFAVSENENPDSFGNFQATKETQKFIEENTGLFEASKTGAAFLAPQEGVQALSAWKYLASMGAKAPKSVENYFNEMVTAEGYAKYRILQKQYYDGIDAGDTSVEDKWSIAKKKLYLAYPMLESRVVGDLSDKSSPNKSDYRSDIEDIRTGLTWMSENNKLDERGQDAQSVIKLYDQMSGKLTGLDPQDPMYEKNRKALKDQWTKVQGAWLGMYEDDVQWRLLMTAVSGALGF